MEVPRAGSLVEPIVAGAEHRPERPALVFIGEDGAEVTLTAGDLHAAALAAAAGLRQAGVGQGDVVVLVMGHSRALIATFLGALYRGAVPCIYSYPSERLDSAVHDERVRTVLGAAGARALVTTPALADGLRPLLGGSGVGVLDANAVCEAPGTARPSAPAPEQPAFLQFTSGTTRLPRGIAHTHRRVLAYVAARAENDRFRAGDVIVSWLPLYHDLGLVSGLLTPLVLGLKTVLMSPIHWVRDPKILIRSVHAHGGTHCWMPNFALNHCARHVQDRDLTGIDLGRWRALVLGGEPVRVSSMRAFVERFAPFGFRDTALMAGYGMAETVEGGTATRQGQAPRVDWVRLRELQENGRAVVAPAESPGAGSFVSCGFPLAGSEVVITDDVGNALPERRVGEIRLRCAYMMEGYHRQPQLTAEVLRDGWLLTGDLGYLAEGELFVCGRRKDLIIVGGRNIYPQDLESVADEMKELRPGRSVAFGLDDDRLGSERIVMVCEVSTRLDAERRLDIERELRRRVSESQDVVLGDVRLVGPGWVIKTSSGKVARAANRDKYRTQLGGDARS